MSETPEKLPDARKWIKEIEFETTEDVAVPKRLIDQVIGQDKAVSIIKKSADQRRHMLLIGDPGTGKSMLAKSMAELLPKSELEDVLVYNNPEDNNEPRVRVVPAGKGREIVETQKAQATAMQEQRSKSQMMIVMMIVGLGILWFISTGFTQPIIVFYSFIAIKTKAAAIKL
jgi:Lon-like ATP-dependent protease